MPGLRQAGSCTPTAGSRAPPCQAEPPACQGPCARAVCRRLSCASRPSLPSCLHATWPPLQVPVGQPAERAAAAEPDTLPQPHAAGAAEQRLHRWVGGWVWGGCVTLCMARSCCRVLPCACARLLALQKQRCFAGVGRRGRCRDTLPPACTWSHLWQSGGAGSRDAAWARCGRCRGAAHTHPHASPLMSPCAGPLPETWAAPNATGPLQQL